MLSKWFERQVVVVVHTCNPSRWISVWSGVHIEFQASQGYTVRPCLKKQSSMKTFLFSTYFIYLYDVCVCYVCAGVKSHMGRSEDTLSLGLHLPLCGGRISSGWLLHTQATWPSSFWGPLVFSLLAEGTVGLQMHTTALGFVRIMGIQTQSLVFASKDSSPLSYLSSSLKKCLSLCVHNHVWTILPQGTHGGQRTTSGSSPHLPLYLR